jgi:hypothetical protein
MPEHLVSTLQRVCWDGSTSLMAAPYPFIDVHGSCGSDKGKKPSKSEKWAVEASSWLEGGWMPEHLAATGVLGRL